MPVSLSALQALVAKIKKRSPASRMHEARELIGRVFIERESDDEARLVVQIPEWSQPPTAVLYPDEGEWACDCGGADPCAHILAAALALEAARLEDTPLRSLASVRSALRYELSGSPAGLRLRRVITRPDGSREVLSTVLAEASSMLSVSDADLCLDRWLQPKGPEPFGPDMISSVFALLSDCADLRLGDHSVSVSPVPLLPRATLYDHPQGFSLSLDKDPSLDSVLCPGVGRVGDTLRPLGAMDLTGDRLDRLPRPEVIPFQDLGDFVLKALPALRARMSVHLQTHRLPEINPSLKPRVDLRLELLGHTLSTLPEVVYGEPACARVERGRLRYLQGSVPLRDTPAEVSLGHALRQELGLSLGARSSFRGTDAVKFIEKLKEWSKGEDAPRGFFAALPLVPRLEVSDEGFELTFELESPEGAPTKTADGASVLSAWREGLGVVPLLDGGFAELPLGWLAKHGERVARLLAAKGDSGALPRAALPSLSKLCDALEHPKPPRLAALSALLDDFTTLPSATLPPDLRASLRPYQRRGVDWLSFLCDAGMGAVLADDMGLGKTLQALTVFRGRVLVVCPRSVVHNWADEISRFRPALEVSTYHGTNRALRPEVDVTLTTYAILRLDAEVLAAVAWDIVVLDEAQAIKNPDSQSARGAYNLKAGFRIALSGTPVENRLDELWSLMHFTNPGLLGGRADFDDKSARPIAEGDPGALSRLRELTAPVLLRRMKRDVAPELPPRSEVVLRCELDEPERAVYDAVRAATRSAVVGALREGANPLMALEALLRLRQAACHSGLVPGQHAESSSKVECLLDALGSANANGHKSLVFSQWTSLLNLVEPHLNTANLAFVRLDGASRDRAEVVQRFQSDDEIRVMLVSLKAGGTGLNLTAADHVFLLDPWWNPAVEDQAEGRAHRIGQTRPVTVYKLVAQDTVEEKIMALQSKKRSITAAALSGAEMATGLTRDELLALLG